MCFSCRFFVFLCSISDKSNGYGFCLVSLENQQEKKNNKFRPNHFEIQQNTIILNAKKRGKGSHQFLIELICVHRMRAKQQKRKEKKIT